MAILFKDSSWPSELQQQLRVTLHLKDIFISSSRFILWNMARTPDRRYRTIEFEWMSKRCTPLKLIVEPYALKPKGALHRMNIGDKRNIINDAKAFLFIIWFDKLRGIHLEEY
jgi:hypothetical protein